LEDLLRDSRASLPARRHRGRNPPWQRGRC